MEVSIKQSASWMMKSIKKTKTAVTQMQALQHNLQQSKYSARSMYLNSKDPVQDVYWRKVMFSNFARPKSVHTLWRACHNSLPTNERLQRFGMLDTNECIFFRATETLDHVFFDSLGLGPIWDGVMCWLKLEHNPQ